MTTFIQDTLAIAGHVFRSACRLKIIQALMAAITCFILLLFFNIDTIGNKLHFIRGFLSYSNYITMFFSGLGTMCIACYLFRMEIEHKHYYYSFTKAVSRPRIFFGNWLGITLINITILSACAALILALVHLTYVKSTAEEQENINREVLCANKIIMPEKLADETEAVLEKGKKGTWNFKNLHPKTDTITIQLDYHSSSSQKIDRIDIDYKAGTGPESVSDTVETYPTQTTTIHLPASVISSDGTMKLELTNKSIKGRSIYIPSEDGLKVMHHSISFTGNFLRITFYALLRNCFLVGVTLFLCSFLTFPVALISSVIFFIMGLAGRTFLFLSQQETLFRADLVEEGTVEATPIIDNLFKIILKGLYYLSGRTSDINTAQILTDSSMFEYSSQILSIYGLWITYTFAALIIGALMFQKSEISKLER